MKLKVLIISLFGNYNYGNKLQNFALAKTIESLDKEAYVLKYNVSELKKRNLTNFSFVKLYKIIKDKILSLLIPKKIMEDRKNNFDGFNNNFKYTDKCYSNLVLGSSELEELDSSYDYNVVGSDQIWNTGITRNKYVGFASFSKKEKNITYAASFGVSELPIGEAERYESGLRNFKSISVREDAGKVIVDNILKTNDSVVLVDPTMLLSANDWKFVSKKPLQLDNERFVVSYFLSKPSDSVVKEINEYCKKYNCIWIKLNDKVNYKYYNCGPAEFLYLIKHSLNVYTDSFHAVVFSLIFHRDFKVFSRTDTKGKTRSRIDTLLNKFEIDDVNNIDYKNVDIILEKERLKGIDYLNNNLL